MKIFLANTGRGGEQCCFTAIVHAYRETFPEAEICVATCPQYENLWALNRDHNAWTPIRYEKYDKFPGDPVGACHDLMREMMGRFDIIEFPSECNAGGGKALTTLDKCYSCIKNPVFAIEAIERRTFIIPTEADKKAASAIDVDFLISHGANSAKPIMSAEGYRKLAEILRPIGEVAYTGSLGKPHMRADYQIPGALDLRGLSLGALHELCKSIRFFIGLDTMTGFLCSHMNGRMIILRGDPVFPLSNTGLVNMGFRQPHNTNELEVFGQSDDTIIKTILEIIG